MAAVSLGLPLLTTSGCALATLATVTPPSVEVQRVELRGASPLDQSLSVALCVTNPNSAELDFRRVTVAMEVAGAPLAECASDGAVLLPPYSSTVVPFAAVTTTRNLVPQVLDVLRTGGLDYRLLGTIQLAGALAITLPFSHSGRLDLLTAGRDLLADTSAPSGTRCG